VRKKRDTDTAFKRITAESYYTLLGWMGVGVVFNHADYRLMSRRALDALREYDEVNLFLRGVIPTIGFPSTTVEYDRKERFAGESKYPLRKMLALAFDGITSYIDYAKESKEAEILTGGGYDKSKGYFIEPTTVVTTNPHFKLMEEEIFGPVVTLYVYPEKEYEKTLEICDTTSPYALTGAVFADDRYAAETALKTLRHAAGNFYINDKPTGAVVGQQPFGGSRASGTNDKAGSPANLMRWTSMRTVKETFCPPTEYRYPYMGT